LLVFSFENVEDPILVDFMHYLKFDYARIYLSPKLFLFILKYIFVGYNVHHILSCSDQLILPGDARTLFNLKGIMRSFFDSMGLHVNFNKSFLVPINMSNNRAQHLANTFGCQLGSMLFTYLGLPLGTTKPSVQDFSPLLNRIERRMSGFSRPLSYDGRLILVNVVLSALPTFYMCSLKIPTQVVKQIDVYRKHCLWSKGDINRKGSCLVAWETAYKPKNQGGLGIIDIEKQNDALLMKHLNSFLQPS